jgi:hypothetical protein
MPPRSCLVTLIDSRGIRHSVEVTAESLFEAGVLAVTAFRKAGWVEEAPGLASRLEIEVREPAVKHTVTLAQLQRWAYGTAKSPVEKIRRERMRDCSVRNHDAITVVVPYSRRFCREVGCESLVHRISCAGQFSRFRSFLGARR